MKHRGQTEESVSLEHSQEYIANSYAMKCFFVIMIVYLLTVILNVLGIFIIEQALILKPFALSCIIYCFVYLLTKCLPFDHPCLKYIILSGNILVLTITGVYLTYHVVLSVLIPIMYSTLYSSKKVMRFVCVMTVISTIIIVYGGYYFGLCDANMVLLTTSTAQAYITEGKFIHTEVNPNPSINLFLFFVVPRCLIYVAFAFACNNIIQILSVNLEKAGMSERLEEEKRKAENANREKSQFLARMSHEIRTPINAVVGMNEMVLRESNEEHIKNYAKDIKTSSLQLLDIVNEILDSSKIESGMMEIVPVNYKMGSLLNDLYNTFSIKVAEKNLNLIFEVDKNIPSELFGDEKRIRQVLINLLSNAVKYTQQGEIRLIVSCESREDLWAFTYTVKDTGMGIREEDIGKIYDAFQRFDMLKNRDVEGSGLGMNITQQLLKLMGSELHIESEYEKGSSFSFSIDQKIVDATPLGDFKERLESAKTEKYQSRYTAPDARILVVDDNKMNIKVFKGLLKETQIQISEAFSGKECLELLKCNSYNLIFLDHMMPEMDGVETLREIKKQKLCENVPIVMLTANAIVGEKQKYINEGFDDYLSKPILSEQLDKIILRYLPQKYIVNEAEAAPVKNEKITKKVTLSELRGVLPEIDFERGLVTCMSDEDFYLELLHDFVHLSIKEELCKYYEQSDYKNYCIRIHGFKNNAYSLGAKELGDLSYEMEQLTRQEFPDEIKDLQERFFEKYNRICMCYNEVAMKKAD